MVSMGDRIADVDRTYVAAAVLTMPHINTIIRFSLLI